MSTRPFVRGARRMVAVRWGLPATALACVAALVALPASSASSAPSPVAATVAAAQPVDLEHAGDTAHVGVTVTTASGQPLTQPVSVAYQTGATLPVGQRLGRPLAALDGGGRHRLHARLGNRQLPRRHPSGTTMTFAVVTLPSSAPSEARTINVSLQSSDPGVTVTARPADRRDRRPRAAVPRPNAADPPPGLRPDVADVDGREDRPDDAGRPLHVHRRGDDQQHHPQRSAGVAAWARCCRAAATCRRPTRRPAGRTWSTASSPGR